MEQESLLFDQPADEAAEEPAEAPQPHIFTVTEITQQVKNLLTGAFADLWIVGEVSSFRPAASGHWYFQLKDESSVLSAVCFRGVNQKFPFKVEEGMELICHGRIDLYAKRGSYQLLIDSAEPKGIGALQLAFEQLKKQLAAEGLFDKAHKKALPKIPRRIGVVTSPTGAAVRDIINVLRRRFPAVDILVAPAKVQGEGSAAEIAAAIELLDTQGACDVIIAGRGGGSIEDLWAFNEEPVARAIYACTTPMVSAVGHEIDFTIADFVADLRAPTPSAAAEIVVPDRAEMLAQLEQARRRLSLGLSRWLQLRVQRLSDLRARLKPPTTRFADLMIHIDHCRERLRQSIGARLRDSEARLRGLAGELQHLSPLAVLAKGYAVATDAKTGQALRHVADVKVGDQIAIRLSDGKLTAEVKEIS